MKRLFAGIMCFGFLFSVVGCANAPRITRTDAAEQIDLSGNWNDTDSQLVSAEMIKDSLSRAWIDEFKAAKATKPRVIVGAILNKSHEHINTETFVNDLQRELINSGRVLFVASKDQRQEIRDERVEQAQNARADTIKSAGQEYGADYMLKGSINTIFDAAAKTDLKYYQVDLELIDILSNEKVWIGQKKIKKIVEQKKKRL